MGNSCVTGAPHALREKIDDPPCQWTIYGFSSLLDKGSTIVISNVFHSCGYEWFLEVTPMHKNFGFGSPYVAVNLHLAENTLEPGYIMNALFELSIYNHSNGTYCGYKGSNNFHVKKWCSEKTCLIAHEELLKSSDFLVDDGCVFGVRILKANISFARKKPAVVPKKPVVVPKKPITVQNLFLQKEFIKGTYTWTMNDFIDMKFPVLSPEFDVGGYTWYIKMCPRGDSSSTKSLSL